MIDARTRIHRTLWEHEAISRLHTEGVKFPNTAYLRALYEAARSFAGHATTGAKEAQDKAFHKWSASLVQRGYLASVRRDLYVNHTLAHIGTKTEAVSLVRPTAIVSLQSVLSDHELTNNPSDQVFAVIPGDGPDATKPRQLSYGYQAKDSNEYATWSYWFVGMNRRLLEAGEIDDRIDSSKPYPCATVERALCDLIVVNADGRSSFSTMLQAEADLSVLDMDRLGRLIEAMGIRDLYDAYMASRPQEEPEQVSRWGF